MKRAGRIAANVLTLGLFGWIGRIVENRKAVRAGLPKPNPPGELVADALGMAAKAALPAVRNDRVREALETAGDLIDTIPDQPTPRERPKHRGLK